MCHSCNQLPSKTENTSSTVAVSLYTVPPVSPQASLAFTVLIAVAKGSHSRTLQKYNCPLSLCTVHSFVPGFFGLPMQLCVLAVYSLYCWVLFHRIFISWKGKLFLYPQNASDSKCVGFPLTLRNSGTQYPELVQILQGPVPQDCPTTSGPNCKSQVITHTSDQPAVNQGYPQPLPRKFDSCENGSQSSGKHLHLRVYY